MDPWWIAFLFGVVGGGLFMMLFVLWVRRQPSYPMGSEGYIEQQKRATENAQKSANSWILGVLVLLIGVALYVLPDAKGFFALMIPVAVGAGTAVALAIVAVVLFVRRKQQVGFDFVQRVNDPAQVSDVLREVDDEIFAKGETPLRLDIRGGCLMALERLDEALDTQRRALELEPTTQRRMNVACVLWRLGRIDEAEPLIADVIAQPDADAIAFANYAQLLARADRAEEARAQLQKAEALFAPYADKKLAEKCGWVRLMNETRELVAHAEDRKSQEVSGD